MWRRDVRWGLSCEAKAMLFAGVLRSVACERSKCRSSPRTSRAALSISEGKEPCTAHRKRRRLGERSVLLLQQEGEGGWGGVGVAPGIERTGRKEVFPPTVINWSKKKKILDIFIVTPA